MWKQDFVYSLPLKLLKIHCFLQSFIIIIIHQLHSLLRNFDFGFRNQARFNAGKLVQFFFILFFFTLILSSEITLEFCASNVSCCVSGYLETDAYLIFPWVSENKDF